MSKMILTITDWLGYGCILLFCLNTVTLIIFHVLPFAWFFISFGLLALGFCQRQFAKDFFLIYVSLIILEFTPITTDISYVHITLMGFGLGLAILLPYLISRFLYKDYLVRFKFNNGKAWSKVQFLGIIMMAFISYLLLPFYFQNSGSYLNWSVELNIGKLIRLLLAFFAVGVWDELFFISTVLGILRRHMSFYLANIVQGIMFTSFLYVLGFREWGAVMIFIFSLIQGYIFNKTSSLLYIITIHVTIDIIMYAVIIHSFYPKIFPIFIT